jgi:hypothetical protein
MTILLWPGEETSLGTDSAIKRRINTTRLRNTHRFQLKSENRDTEITAKNNRHRKKHRKQKKAKKVIGESWGGGIMNFVQGENETLFSVWFP